MPHLHHIGGGDSINSRINGIVPASLVGFYIDIRGSDVGVWQRVILPFC
jgi:hypothetical protein